MNAKGKRNHVSQIHSFLVSHYDLQELRELCADLRVEYENLGSTNTRTGKARELLLQVGRHHQFDLLIERLKQTRPIPFQSAGLGVDDGYFAKLYTDLVSFEENSKPVHQKVLEQISLTQRTGFIIIIILVTTSASVLYLALRQKQPSRMTGDFRIAVAEFEFLSDSYTGKNGYDLSYGIFLKTQQVFEELETDISVTIWDPSGWSLS